MTDAEQLDALARERGLKVDRSIFDAGMTVTVSGAIGRLPYRNSVTREWGSAHTADAVALVALQARLATKRIGG